MIVMALQNVPPALLGKLSRYLIETANGVYVGTLSARVRDKLWDTCEKARKDGTVFQAWSTNSEQGFTMRLAGGERSIVDWEGLRFVLEPTRPLTHVEKRRVSGEV
jgi:CRISPR-associated protein Cas2